MILWAVYDGGADPLEGERELVLRGLPADARVIAARATVTPIDPSEGRDPFVEEIRFSGPTGAVGDWGATQVRATGFAEIDFHTRRTLAGLEGSGLSGARLHVDLGGSFVGVDPQGGLAPAAGPFLSLVNDGPVPGIAASRVRVSAVGNAPAVAAVRLRSLPTNVTLALAGRPALFFHAGELAVARTAPDFGALLAGYLEDGAAAADGVFALPFVLHSDSIARLHVAIAIEYVRSAALLPAGLPEAKLAYDLATVPRAGSAVLEVELPAAAVPVPGASAGKVTGPFAETRIAWGPIGETETGGRAVPLSPAQSAAQPLALPDRPEGYEIVAVDLRLAALDREVKLTLDLRRDESGKPGADSLLEAPVPFELSRAADGGESWLSVELPRPVTLRSASDRKAWLLLQSAEGEAAWSVGTASPRAAPLQASADGGFSYRAATRGDAAPLVVPLAASLRLRERPARFRLPLSAQLGVGAGAVRVDLSRLSPLGKVAFDLSIPEIAAGISAALDQARTSADGPRLGDLLADPAFARWQVAGDEIGAPRELSLSEAASSAASGAISVTGASDAEGAGPELTELVAFAPDGRTAFGVLASSAGASHLVAWDTEVLAEAWRLALVAGSNNVPSAPRRLVVDPTGRFVFLLLPGGVAVVDIAARRLLSVMAAAGAFVAPVALAFSDDGSKLAIAEGSDGEGGLFALAIYDAERFVDHVRRGSVATAARLQYLALTDEPVDLAFSADGARLYLLTSQLDSDSGDTGALIAHDARSLAATAMHVLFDGAPRALARVADGSSGERSLLVLHPDRLDRYDAATLAPMPSLALPGEDLAALAVEPGGRRALLAGATKLLAVALAPAGMRLAPARPGVGPTAGIAVGSLGDRALALSRPVASGAESRRSARVIPIGVARPLAWTATAGRVRPATLTGSIGRGVELGATAEFSTQGELPPLPLGPSALSQVVPATPGHTYELSFLGRAAGQARAEVLWRAASGETRGEVVLPIGPGAVGDPGEPSLQRGRFLAPAEVIAAEIRFVAEDGFALIRNTSFREPENALENSDLAGGAGTSWVPQPLVAPGFRVTAAAAGSAGSQVRNASAVPVTLRQEVAAVPGTPFELRVRSRLESGLPPRVVLRFLAADDTAVGAVVTIEIPVRGFDAALAIGVVPSNAARAEVVLSMPAGASLRIEAIELGLEPRVRIPLTFLAEAPGELAVIGAAIAWDLADENTATTASRPLPSAPPLPAPTPPPGAVAEDDECGYHDEEEAAAPRVPPVPTLSAPIDAFAIAGIGPRRAEILRGHGITTLGALVDADPRELARVLPSVSERMAVGFIRQARALVG